MKEMILAFIQKYPAMYRLAKFGFSRYCLLMEPKIKYSELTSSEQAMYQKLKKAFK